VTSIPGSFDIVDPGAHELGLSGYPRVPPLPSSWRQVVGGAEFTCSQVVTMGRLLKEVLAMIGRDVLQPTRVSLETETRGFLPGFPLPFLGSLMPSLL
jgi:hypothetical protein